MAFQAQREEAGEKPARLVDRLLFRSGSGVRAHPLESEVDELAERFVLGEAGEDAQARPPVHV